MMDIKSISHERYEIAVQVRGMHFNCEPSLVEDIKYGGLVFIKGEELISGIFFYKQHISIEFGQGANLPDPDSVLEGKGKDRRHIKIRSREDIATKNIAQYVQSALAD